MLLWHDKEVKPKCGVAAVTHSRPRILIFGRLITVSLMIKWAFVASSLRYMHLDIRDRSGDMNTAVQLK